MDRLRRVFQGFSGVGFVFDGFSRDFVTPSGGHKPYLGQLKILILLETSFKNRLF